MKTLEESIVIAMDGTEIAIFPYLPYILQDLWEIGSDPEIIINLIKKHCNNYHELNILDLGCGKGVVSIKLAKKLGCKCHGIDGIPEFITFAKQKASEFHVEHLCSFEYGDIRESVKNLSNYDVIILGSIGPVFGDYYSTLTTISPCIHKDGIIIYDDGYIENTSNFSRPLIQKETEILKQIDESKMKIIDKYIIEKEEIKTSDDYIFDRIKQRCNELVKQYPTKKKMFLDYIKKQEEENYVLENEIVPSTLVLKFK